MLSSVASASLEILLIVSVVGFMLGFTVYFAKNGRRIFEQLISGLEPLQELPPSEQQPKAVSFEEGNSAASQGDIRSAFDPVYVRKRLRELAGTKGFRQYVIALRIRYTLQYQIELIEQYVRLYDTGTKFIDAEDKFRIRDYYRFDPRHEEAREAAEQELRRETRERLRKEDDRKDELQRRRDRVTFASLDADREEQVTRKHRAKRERTRVASPEYGQASQPVYERPKSPDEQKFEEKKSQRLIDILDELFEEIELPFSKHIQAHQLYRKLRHNIYSHPDLTPEEKDVALARLKERFDEQMSAEDFSIYREA